MKKEWGMWLIIAALIVGTLILAQPKEQVMAIDFGNTNGHAKSVEFTAPASIVGLAQKTVVVTFKVNSAPSQEMRLFQLDNGTGGWSLSYIGGGANRFYFYEYFTGTDAALPAVTDLATATVYQYAITYDSSSVDNHPIIYLNGVDDSSVTFQHPTGSKESETGAVLALGNNQYNNSGAPVTILDFRIYNRILSAAEVAAIYSARGADNIRSGLVFCPMLHGAKGLQVYDGATLTADNTILDPCSGAVGVPTGSPVGLGETCLMIK